MRCSDTYTHAADCGRKLHHQAPIYIIYGEDVGHPNTSPAGLFRVRVFSLSDHLCLHENTKAGTYMMERVRRAHADAGVDVGRGDLAAGAGRHLHSHRLNSRARSQPGPEVSGLALLLCRGALCPYPSSPPYVVKPKQNTQRRRAGAVALHVRP